MSASDIARILVTGAAGQVGCALVAALGRRYGPANVVAADIKFPPSFFESSPPRVRLDVTDREALAQVVQAHRIDTIYHLAAILSANGEKNPQACWQVNVGGLLNVLEVAREYSLRRVICPSSMAVFGPDAPRQGTPQDTLLHPTTMYGVTKVSGELLGEYYFRRYGVDVRGIRYPGIISSEARPGGGTTDYAVEIFYAALQERRYTCFLREDTVLPMIYMPDVIEGTIQLAEADPARLTRHTDYNMTGFSIAPRDLAAEIQRHLPDFEIAYAPDARQAIADSWPAAIDDRVARRDWGWRPRHDLAAMTADMLDKLAARQRAGSL